MPRPKKVKQAKRRVLVAKDSSGNSSSSSGKVKAFKKPGIVLKEQKKDILVPAATALAGFAAGAILANYRNPKEIIRNVTEDGATVREQVNQAKSEIFRECKEGEVRKINDLNDKNEKNTKIIAENNKTIAVLREENVKLQKIVNTAEARYQGLKEKYFQAQAKLQTTEENLKFAKGAMFRGNNF